MADESETQMGKWEPISTAPKDGLTSILGYQRFESGGERMLTMMWSERGGHWSWRADVHSFIAFEPTHWMPLPEPPDDLPPLRSV